MIKRIQHWLAELKRAHRRQQECDGFGWAMSAHHIEGYTTGEIMSLVDPRTRHLPFEQGVIRAVATINRDQDRRNMNGQPVDVPFFVGLYPGEPDKYYDGTGAEMVMQKYRNGERVLQRSDSN